VQNNELNFLDEPIETDATTDIIYMMWTLSILTDYDGALEDIPDWCAKTGNEFMGIYEDDDHYKFFIRKLKES